MAINARLLPTVWYSKLDPREGEPIRIFAAIQNDSGIDFGGTAIFLVRGEEVGRSEFKSVSGKLSVVSTSWKAEQGSNSIDVKVEADLPAGESLASAMETDAVLHVSKLITADVIKADAKEAFETVQGKGDSIAEAIVQKLEDLKQASLVLDPEAGPIGKQGSVLGTTTQSWPKKATSKALAATYEGGIGLAQFAVTHWAWSIGALVLLAGVWKVWRRNAPNPEDF
jgi:hypothetical protein